VLDLIAKDAISSFRWIDAVDIIVVAFIIYKLLILIRGTRAVQALVGLIVFASLYVISVSFGLITLHEILRRFFSYLVIIIIIVFQDDIKKLLAKIGKAPFFNIGQQKSDQEHFIEQLVKSCISLSRKKIGALIAIERNISLVDAVEIGTNFDAELKPELIASIFSTSSPMHDGAVLIKDGRIFAAGCFLPLTNSSGIEKTLGTRHRAAIGLAEVTDAVIIVVSEEQRQMSVAVDGNLIRSLDGPELRKTLYEIFGGKGKK
jgi:diadenylate cyclase